MLFLAITFRSADENHSCFSARWWGILSLIGWSYLFCALTYMFTRNRLKYLIPAWLIRIRYQSMPGLKKLLGALTLVLALGIAGFITHKFWIISKLSATPPWLFYVTAVTISVYGILYYIVETGLNTALCLSSIAVVSR